MSSRSSRSTKRKADEDAPAPAVAAVATKAAAATKGDVSKKQKRDTEHRTANNRKAKGTTAAADSAANQPSKKQASKPAKKEAAAPAAVEKLKSKKTKVSAAADAVTSKQSSSKQAEKSKSKKPDAGAVAPKGTSKQPAKTQKEKKSKKQTPAAAEEPPKKAKRLSKRQQQQQQEEEEEEEEEENEQEDQKSPHDVFMELIAEKEKQLNKHCIILEQFDGDEDEVTIEELQKLKKVFVPEKTWEEFVEVWSELDSVGEGSEDEGEGGEEEEGDGGLAAFMKAFMGKFLNTKHGAEMHAILNKYLKAVDKSLKAKAWQDAFCTWAAVVMAARREGHWWEDTDVPDAAVAIYNKLREQWGKLKARSDEELGGLVCEGELSAKDELGAYLQGMADEMKQMDYDVPNVA